MSVKSLQDHFEGRWQAFLMKVPVRGVELFYEMTGSGTPCVLVHGGRATANMRRRGTPAMQQAYRALWGGSITDARTFQQAFETILPLYYRDRSRGRQTEEPDAFMATVRRFLARLPYPCGSAGG